MNTHDTVAAIATPVGAAGIGVIRISGSAAMDVASRIFRSVGGDVSSFDSHTAHFGHLVHPMTNERIDDVVLTLFREPRSYTGENVVEISCHGGISILKSALNVALSAGARLAEPGEFTKRAFLNGRLDLAQAEAVNDLIRARTDEARKAALQQLDGKLSERVRDVSNRVLGVIAAVEAAIDFPDDVPEPEPEWIRNEVEEARSILDNLLSTFERGRIYREGLRMVIAGRVNVGKSSLLNALLRHARAIVTPIPGTTRDVIEESLEISGIPVVAIDTAGIRVTEDVVEQIGVERSRESLESADLVLLVFDATEGFTEEDKELLANTKGKHRIAVLNKIDTASASALEDLRHKLKDIPKVETSAATGKGIEQLEEEIARLVAATGVSGESALVTNTRHQSALQSAKDSLTQTLNTLKAGEPIDFLSVDLLAARNSLGLVTGETAAEDLVDRIFSDFCIGK